MKVDVLLVDDEIITNIMHKMVLESNAEFNSISCVNNGRQAVEFLECCIAENRALPDIILLDLNMPIMNGFEFLEALTQRAHIDHKTIRVIVVSSSLDPVDRKRAFDLGASDFFSKPLDVRDVHRILSPADRLRCV